MTADSETTRRTLADQFSIMNDRVETAEEPLNRQLSGRLRKRRVIECTQEESARMLNALGKALTSPTRDDGSSKKEFRRG